MKEKCGCGRVLRMALIFAVEGGQSILVHCSKYGLGTFWAPSGCIVVWDLEEI